MPGLVLSAYLAGLLASIAWAQPLIPLEVGRGAYLKFDSFGLSEPQTLKDSFEDYDGKLEGGRVTFVQSRLETGAVLGRWRVAGVLRYDLSIDPSRDTVEFYHATRSDAELEPNRVYELDLNANQFHVYGLALGRLFQPRENLIVELGLQILHGEELIDGRLLAQATATAGNNYQASGSVNYAYEEDALFDRGTESVRGTGHAFNMALDWRFAPDMSLRADVRDVFARIYWDDIPYTEATVETDNRTFGDDGFVEFNPVLTGVEGNRDHTQHLSAYGRVQLIREFEHMAVYGGLRFHTLKTIPEIGVSRRYGSVFAGLQYLPVQGGLGVSLRWQGLSVAYLADRLRFDDAQVFGLQLQYRYAF